MKKTLLAACLLAAALLVGAASHHGPEGKSILEPSSLTVDTAAYGDGDLIGKHTGGYLTFADACRVTGAGGVIRSAVIADAGAQSAAIDLILFSAAPSASTLTDNAALDLDDADIARIAGVVAFAAASYKAFADNSAIAVGAVDQRYHCVGTTALYGVLVSRGTPDYVAATDLTLRLFVERD